MTRHPSLTILSLFLCCFLVARGQDAATAGESLALSAPHDAVTYVEVPDVAALGAALRDSDIGAAFKASPLFGAGAVFLRAALDLAVQFAGGIQTAELRSLLPTQWSAIVLPQAEGADAARRSGFALAGRLTQTDGRLQAVWSEHVLPTLTSLDKGFRAKVETVPGGTIHVVQKGQEPPFCVSFTERFLVLGNPLGIRAFLAAQAQPGESLGTQSRYTEVAQRFAPSPLASVYVDVASAIDRKLADLPEGSKERREMESMGFDTLRGIGGTTRSAGSRFHETVLVHTERDSAQGVLGLINTSEPILMRSASLIPDDYGAHLALSITGGADLLAAIRELVFFNEGDQGINNMNQGFEFLRTQTGVDFEADVFGQIGAEVFAAVKLAAAAPWKKGGMKKLRPSDFEFVIGLKVNDAAKAKETVAQFLGSPLMTGAGFEQTTETHQDVEIFVVTGAKLPGGKQAYAFLADFLVFSREPATIKRAVDALCNKKNLQARAGYQIERTPFDEPVIARLHLDLSPQLAAIDDSLLSKIKPPALRPFMNVVKSALSGVGAATVVVRPSRDGLVLDADLPLPVITTVAALASIDGLSKSALERQAETARERMKNVSKALRKYYRKNNVPPDSLLQLVPGYIADLPGDPFLGDDPFGYGVAAGGSGWILVSVGPDGKPDVDVDAYNAQEWQALLRATDPATVAEARRLIYQHGKKNARDEKAADDEGDIVMTGTW